MLWLIILLSAALQGITEFLPVSSSGHLRLLQAWFGVEEPQTFLDICLHAGTLGAVLIFYRERVTKIVSGMFRGVRDRSAWKRELEPRLGLLLVLGMIPTGILGLSLGSFSELHLASMTWVGVWLIANGGVLLWTKGREQGSRDLADLKPRDVLVVGFVQGLAVLRGISRSGSTIASGLALGLKREAAAELSFLLSIPAIMAAVALKTVELAQSNWQFQVPPEALLVGTLLSAFIGYLALRFLLFVVDRGQLHRFAPYCVVLGVAAILSGQNVI